MRMALAGEPKGAAIIRAMGGAVAINRDVPVYEMRRLLPRFLELWRTSGPTGPAPPEPIRRAMRAARVDDELPDELPPGGLISMYKAARALGAKQNADNAGA
jgi:hypothetical protein